MKNVITHIAAFAAGAVVFAVAGLVICEKVEAFGGDVATDEDTID